MFKRKRRPAPALRRADDDHDRTPRLADLIENADRAADLADEIAARFGVLRRELQNARRTP